jgi:hypothetical protein
MELPEELLVTKMGLMDDRTLCTTRLACKRFRKYSLTHLKALHLDCETLEQHPTSDFTLFPAVTQCAVSFRSVSRLHLAIAGHPRVAPIITHIHVRAFHCPEAQIVESLAQLMHLPRLRSLSLPAVERDLCKKLSLPLGLEELKMALPHGDVGQRPLGEGMWDVSPLTRCCKLTGLEVHVGYNALLSVGSLASLSSLRSLKLTSYPSATEEVSRLTMLTSLTWVLSASLHEVVVGFHSLVHLTGLSQLKVGRSGWGVTHDEVASLSHLTRLTCLDIQGWHLPPLGADPSFLVPLTRLVSLGLRCGQHAAPLHPESRGTPQPGCLA